MSVAVKYVQKTRIHALCAGLELHKKSEYIFDKKTYVYKLSYNII